MPLKIIETEKEGHRKVKTKEPKRYQGQKSDLYGTKKYKEIKVSNTQTGLSKGRKKFQHGGRTNLLEELGRVEAEPSNRNRRAEISRVHGELNKGYAKGGSTRAPKRELARIKDYLSGGQKAKPHSSKEGRTAAARRKFRRIVAGAGKPLPRRPMPKIPKRIPGRQRPIDPRSPYVKDRVMTPLRAKKAVGGIAQVGPGKPDVDHGTRKRNKESKKTFNSTKNKAPGGRIRRGHGGSTMQQHYLQHGYGPTKAKLRSGKPKIAKKGWA